MSLERRGSWTAPRRSSSTSSTGAGDAGYNRKAFATGVSEPTQQRAGDTGPLGGWTAPRGKELHLSSAVFCFL